MHVRVRLARVLAALVVGLGATASVANAGWLAGSGIPEPNTAWDLPRYMFQAPNQAPADRIYFNGLLVSSAGPATYDAQLDGGTIVSPASTTHAAILGFWRDCNLDGYIGMKLAPASAGSFSAYPRALSTGEAVPISDAVCPLGTPYNPIDPVSSEPGAFIDELRWIGPNAMWFASGQASYNRDCGPIGTRLVLNSVNCYTVYPQTPDRTDVNDANARVWADWNAPGLPHIPDGGILAPGAMEDSNGTLDYADHHLGHAPSVLLGAEWESRPAIGECDPDEPELFGGPDGTCGAWPLYQAKRLVNDSDGVQGDAAHPEPLVRVFDDHTDSGGPTSSPCDDNFLTEVPAPSSGPNHDAYLPDAEPTVHENVLVEGSLAGTATHVWAATDGLKFTGQCADRTPSLLAVDNAQDEILTTHIRPDVELRFVPDSRLHVLRAAGFDDFPADFAGLRGTTGVAGVPGWYGRAFAAMPPRHLWGSLTPVRVTYYADVTSEAIANANANAAIAFPGGAQNRYAYGVPEFCPGVTTGPPNVQAFTGWDCSRTSWEEKADRDHATKRPLVGDAYDLRDVDCSDNAVSESYLGHDARLGPADCWT